MASLPRPSSLHDLTIATLQRSIVARKIFTSWSLPEKSLMVVLLGEGVGDRGAGGRIRR